MKHVVQNLISTKQLRYQMSEYINFYYADWWPTLKDSQATVAYKTEGNEPLVAIQVMPVPRVGERIRFKGYPITNLEISADKFDDNGVTVAELDACFCGTYIVQSVTYELDKALTFSNLDGDTEYRKGAYKCNVMLYKLDD